MEGNTLAGTTLAGYRLEALLGRGGMGEVYRASDPELERDVALKLISAVHGADVAFRERFSKEVAAQAALEHPHVCPVYRAGETPDGTLYVAMRLLSGGSLAEAIAGSGPLEPARTASLLGQLASALDAAHARGLVHADVKPANVLLDEAANVYLCDFGLAALADKSSVGEDGSPTLAGTLSYLAPECLQGAAASPASDLYALACLGYCALTGEPPFVRKHEVALAFAHLRDAPPSLAKRGLGRLDAVFATALAKDPRERTSSCQVFADGLAAAIGRPEPAEQWPALLPRPATRLVGRRAELDELNQLLSVPETRLLTLTGPGGTGKTRLALQAAAEASSSFAEGARWVSLAPLAEPAHALSAIAQALDVPEQAGVSLRDTLTQALASRRILLCLDNCEHLLPAFAYEIAALRDVEAGPLVLCTSRERLDLQAERLYPVPALSEDEGVELFRERASYVNPRFDPDDPAIATLCERLDSLPLALELAAARSDLYSPRELLSALEGQLELLHGARDHDPRHRTLAATIAWSYDLLAAEEQRSFRALSVFAGGCTAEAALEVADADLALLQSLVSKSLLRTREGASSRRYFMLETVRQYAAGRLEEEGEADATRERHSRYFCRLAVATETLLEGQSAGAALAELTNDSGNLRTALARALNTDPVRGLEAGGALYRYWLHRGREREGFDTLEAALLETAPHVGRERAVALVVVGTLAWDVGEWELGREKLDQAIEELRTLDDPRWLSRALNNRGLVALYRGDHAEARALYSESAALSIEIGDQLGAAMTFGNMGLISLESGEFSTARVELQRTVELMRLVGSSLDVALGLYNLGCVELVDGDVKSAATLASDAIELAVDNDSPRIVMESQVLLARCLVDSADGERARDLLCQVIDNAEALDHVWALVMGLEAAAEFGAFIARKPGDALLLLGASDRIRDELEMDLGAPDLIRRDLTLGAVVAQGYGESDAQLARGRDLARQAVLRLAHGLLDPDGEQ